MGISQGLSSCSLQCRFSCSGFSNRFLSFSLLADATRSLGVSHLDVPQLKHGAEPTGENSRPWSAQGQISHLSNKQEQVKKTYRTVQVKLEEIRAQVTHQIVNLGGTFPISFKGVTYNLPLHVRVLPDFPNSAPVVFLVPTPGMAIVRQHKNIDDTGRCYFPYLSSWTSACSLTGLIQVMSEAFSLVPPLYSKPKVLPAEPPAEIQSFRPDFVPPMPSGYAQSHPGDPSPPSSSSQFVPPSNFVASNDPGQLQFPEEDPDLTVDPKLCIVCFERPKEALITPCNHLALCLKDANYCKNHGHKCPVCRGPIESVIRVYIA